jgi:signal transduction histidine kinase
VEATTTTNLHSASATTRRRVPPGEKLYTIVRWGFVLLLLYQVSRIADMPPWEIPLTDPMMLVLITYGVVSLLLTIGLLLPVLTKLHSASPFIDLLFLVLVGLFAQTDAVRLLPFYLFPLLGLAIRQKFAAVIATSASAALLFAASGVAGVYIGNAAEEMPTYALNQLLPAALLLLFLPTVMSSLVERWSSANRQSIEAAHQAAQQQAEQAQQQVDQAWGWVHLLYEVATKLATIADSTPGQKQVLNTALEECQRLIPYTHAIVLIKSDDAEKSNELSVEAGQALNPRDLGSTITIKPRGRLDDLIQAGKKPVLMKDSSQEEELQQIATLKTCRSAWVIPVEYGAQIYGAIILGSETPGVFATNQQEMLMALAQLTSVALRNGQLLAELKPHREKLLKSEAKAREELTRHVHDGLAQTLAQIVMNTDILRRMVKQDPDTAVKELEELHTKFKQYHFEVREVLTALSPIPLGQGLHPVLTQFLERKQQNYQGMKITLEAGTIKGLTLHYETENMLYNIVQESVNNALKYAEAHTIRVRCWTDGNRIIMTVEDDGKGFDVEEGRERARKKGSFGLFNIGERARLVGGTAEIYSKVGRGSFIRVVAPVTSSRGGNGTAGNKAE